MAAGITQPGGAGTDIIIFDDSDTGGGRPAGPYTFAQISAAFPADFIDLGTYQKSYRSLVNLKIGDSGSVAATTTLQDTNVKVTWDQGFTLTFRTTQVSSWYLILGTKCGTGNQAGGANGCDLTFGFDTTLRGNLFIYGSKLRKKASGGGGRITITTGITGSVGEMVDSDVQSDLNFNATNIGSTTQKLANLYNTSFQAPTAAAQPVIGNFFITNVERVLMAAQSNSAFIATNGQDIGFKDMVMRGTVSQSDFRLNSGAARWEIVRPGWSQSGLPKITFGTAFSITLANALRERWLYRVKVVDENGDALAGIRIQLTDVLGNIQVDAITDANGQISFGANITLNAVLVMDHYGTAGVYQQRHRGPFIRTANLLGPTNPLYHSDVRIFKWPGHETVTATAGSFEDVSEIIQLLPRAGISASGSEENRPFYG